MPEARNPGAPEGVVVQQIHASMTASVVFALALQAVAGQLPPRFDIQGHRGARGLLPENTIAGFLRAVDLGVSTLEMDVVVAGDSTVVASHEPWMSATICSDVTGRAVTNGQFHNIYRMSYEEVMRYDCGSRGHPDFPRQEALPAAKPRLQDVITAAEAHVADRGLAAVRYNIEVKSRPDWDGVFTPAPREFVQRVYDVVVEADIADRVTLQSFDMRSLRAARQIGAAWQTALLVGSRADLEADITGLGFVPEIYSPLFKLVDDDLVRAAHSRGMRLIPWTVNSVSDMVRLKTLGVDGLITDYPDIARAVSDF